MGSVAKTPKNGALSGAVHRHEQLTKQGLLERAFTFAFRGLVYAQIWEDPDVDMEALQITPESHVVTIASGGCNVFSYLTANPKKITAVDLNTTHIALANLKKQAALHLPDYASFHRFFGEADRPENIEAYKTYIRPHLDSVSRRYWESRDMVGRRRISGFKSGFYKKGLLGGLIGFVHLMAKTYGIDPKMILEAKTIEEQREIFEAKFAPFFDKKFLRRNTTCSPQTTARGSPARSRAGSRSSPAISNSPTIISPGRPLGGAMARVPMRRCRPISRLRSIRTWSAAPTGWRSATRI